LNIIIVVHLNVTFVVPFVVIFVPFVGSVFHSNVTVVVPFVVIVVPIASSVVHSNVTTVVPFVMIVAPFAGSVVHMNVTNGVPSIAIVVPFFGKNCSFKRNNCCSFLRLFFLLFLSFESDDFFFPPRTRASDMFSHSFGYEIH
jgi:hypothetical protein